MRFVDSNVWLYAMMQGTDPVKRSRAISIVRGKDVVISTQVVNETCSNVIKKAGYDSTNVRRVVEMMYRRAIVLPVTKETMLKAADLRDRHQLSFWDSQLAACAVLSGCTHFESEDMQDGLVISGQLRICNPFKP